MISLPHHFIAAARSIFELQQQSQMPPPLKGRSQFGKSPYIEVALNNEIEILRKTVDGNRNNQLNKSVFSIAGFIGQGITEPEVRDAFEVAAQSIGLDTQEVKRTIQSAIEAGIRNPRIIPDKHFNSHSPYSNSFSAQQEQSSNNPSQHESLLLCAADFPAKATPRSWIVPHWIPQGCVTGLFGAGGTGKSLLAQQLATAIAVNLYAHTLGEK